ncbi:leucine--tRNA ligase [Candidatus Microgenomates bacterium]|nr:leucine--tRNA ligase [Candidatus Microgenomates bacterium]
MAKSNSGSTYNPSVIEGKWQGIWEKSGIYKTPESPQNKKYILDMFPYPSGESMHVGHLEGYVGTDIISRYLRMRGYDVLHPMGWDAFGLPSENYAIKTGIPPAQSTEKNIKTFKRQLQIAGLSYDWEREINTSSPEYYKWNQWLFILMYERGLAYRAKSAANWCSSCETVLANEQVVDGKCERCGTEVVQKEIEQWFLKITDYADRLISGLSDIDWLEEVKIQQKNWIGKKEGIDIHYGIEGKEEEIVVWTSRPDTNFGATFLVLAPEHPLALKIADRQNEAEIKEYIGKSKKKKKLDRISEGRVKTGVFTGAHAINQLTGEKMPIWVSDFVLMEVGTGALVGVPGHDVRDFEFAKQFSLPIKRVVVGQDGDTSDIRDIKQVQEKEGEMVNSGFLDGMEIHEATKKMIDYFVEKGWGERKVNYHMHDWTISRQRYWGTPIPMIYCEKCNWQPVALSDLPVLLPEDVDFKPTGGSPIATSKEFQKSVACPECGGAARREEDTMDGYFDSSWYHIRYADAKNDEEFASQKAIKDWLPVDVYVGGGHVVQHLLFARFFWKVLFDAGLIGEAVGDEPFLKLRAPGWILGPDSRKMSKRWGNVVTPDDVIPVHGADAMRMYEMFMGPFSAMKPWNLTGVEGVSRFLKRLWVLFDQTWDGAGKKNAPKVGILINKLVKKVGEDIENMNFNTAISSMMETYNSLVDLKEKGIAINWKEVWEKFVLVLAPFAPHITEEFWNKMGHSTSVHLEKWPIYDPSLIEEDEVTIPVQVNGKLRGTVIGNKKQVTSKEEIEKMARSDENVGKHLEGMETKKVIFVPGKLINFVVN